MPAEQGFGPGIGNWGLFEAEDETIAAALIAAAEDWLRGKGMTRVLGPISCRSGKSRACWSKGYDHPPTMMMGHAKPAYRGWIEARGLCAGQDSC